MFIGVVIVLLAVPKNIDSKAMLRYRLHIVLVISKALLHFNTFIYVRGCYGDSRSIIYSVIDAGIVLYRDMSAISVCNRLLRKMHRISRSTRPEETISDQSPMQAACPFHNRIRTGSRLPSSCRVRGRGRHLKQ